MLTQDQAKKAFHYEPDSGVLTWKCRPSNRASSGDMAGFIAPSGYRMIGYLGRHYRAHHIAWLIMTGSMPSKSIDHINRSRTDNRWENLREASDTQNCYNQSLRRNNTSGVKGVTRWSATGIDYFLARLVVNKKVKSKVFNISKLGLDEAFRLAVAHIEMLREMHHGEFAAHCSGEQSW